MNFCEQCWDAQVVHKKHRRGIPHEKTNPDVAAKVHNVLSPPQDEDVREELYKVDAPTAWFGVERPDDSSAPLFQDYGRFAELMATTDPVLKDPAFVERWTEIGRDKRTPSLVSFVGQTGAGKSTLIKLLIDFAAVGNGTYSSPVVGPRGAHIPTSEDVHLYVDPKTADSAGPLLYSDCEGLEGGEREPLAAKFKRKRRQGHTESDLPKTKVISERELQWANEPRARSREFAVTNLYPRLLYTFSDVIVFVLRNPRVIEHVFERLVKWAAAAIETSSNQPVLPHAIIALNASENDSDVTQWDVPHSTESILFDLQNTVNRNETFKKWAQFWRERGRTIETLLHLILCYYSSIQIIRLPAEGRPKLMEDQINQLYASILSGSIAARHARYQARMLLDVEDLNNYLQEAFNHYSNTLESPFDFVQASFRNSPIPPDFGGNILKLALEMMAILKAEKRLDARRIFAELSYMVASCIMLDSARNNNKGSSSQIFPKYIHHLDDALENFCDQHWPCEFVNHKTGARCVNVRSGHSSKGHQSADGKVFATGDWISNFSFADHGPTFRVKVYHCLTELLKELTTRMQDNSESEEQLASEIHKSIILTNLLSHAKFSDANSRGHRCLISHTACFCCLFGQAEHCLPCGHVLCNACLHTYGFPKGANGLEIRDCPFESIPEGGLFPRLIRLKPKSAGTRVITLDGGGIRGIIELETLRQIELALGGVPIQFFVDLIVGTSTGGIIALGLASMGWTVDKCIEYFESLCHEAFTRRLGSSLPVIGSFVDNYHHSKYQTSTLENALQEAFTDNISLFGGPQPALSNVKVAVTATSLAGNKTYILSNYNHQHRNIERPNYYHFQRPELPSAELKVWEAARATSAAPRFFKSFHHELSQKTYIDGAMFHNNPVRVADSERKILWPDSQIPDIFLSIGTGSTQSLERSGTEKMEAARKGIFSHGRYLYNIMRSNIQQTLDCERAWDDYISSVANSFTSPSPRSRFLRINPNVGEIPALDEKDKIASLRRKAEVELKLDLRIKDLARQLIASTFYFDIISVSEVDEENGTIDIRGQIRCRLLQPSAEMDEFSQHLKARTSGNEEMKFVIFQDGDTKPLVTVYLTPTVADTMIRNRYIQSVGSRG
ncbi:putative lysophospholipase-like protein [Rosellinia necatrix]|uniref:Putative lysophospholipase-like protein n=1 Tax=Rosellinia necatrix TaxID=77044 RepID=A0A1S8A958_ROSNE|nr:putative lysophospholipase-like protein [Rosellinia necatrix]